MSAQVESISEKIMKPFMKKTGKSQVESISEKMMKPFMKKTGKSILMQPKKSSEQPGSSKEEEYERLMMEMKILLQEKYEEVDSLSDEIKKQKMLQEELRGEVEEKVRELSEVQKEFSGYQDKVTVLLNSSKEMDEDRLRSLVQDLKKSDCGESLKVIERLKIGGVVVVEDKAEMEDDRQQVFDELLLRAKREGDIEMKKLQRVLDALSLVLQSQMSSFEDVFSQKSEMEKVLDITLKESQVIKSKIHDLELNSASILEKNLKLTKDIEKLTAEMKSSTTTFEDSLLSSDSFSLQESSLDGSVKSVEHLNCWEEEEELITGGLHNNKDAEKFRTTIFTLQKENEELQSKVAEIGESYKEALKKAEMMQRKLDFVIEEKKEKEMLMNERDVAANDEIVQALLRMTKKVETVIEENQKLKKDTKLGLNMLQNNAVRLELMDWNRVRLEQELETRNQEIDKLRKLLKTMGVLPESKGALYKSFLRLMEELETLRSMKDEMEKLKEGLRFGSQCAAG